MISLNCLNDCDGACCKHVTAGNVPFTADELEKLNSIYDEELAKIERIAYARRAGDLTMHRCRRLTKDGLCWFESNNLHKPITCVTSVIPGDNECLEVRNFEGYSDGAS